MKTVVYQSQGASFPGMKMLKEVKATFKESGFKGLRKKYGWKIFAAVIAYYIIRDVTIYIVIPYLVIDHI